MNIVDNHWVRNIVVVQIVDAGKEYLEVVGHCTVVHVVGLGMVEMVLAHLQMVSGLPGKGALVPVALVQVRCQMCVKERVVDSNSAVVRKN